MRIHNLTAKILVVDDDPLIRGCTERTLALAGFKTAVAVDGADALACLETTAFDAVVSDVRMPRIDGFELLDHIRLRFPDVPVVLMTGCMDEAMEQKALAGGARVMLEKPVASEDLIVAVVSGLRTEAAELAVEGLLTP